MASNSIPEIFLLNTTSKSQIAKIVGFSKQIVAFNSYQDPTNSKYYIAMNFQGEKEIKIYAYATTFADMKIKTSKNNYIKKFIKFFIIFKLFFQKNTTKTTTIKFLTKHYHSQTTNYQHNQFSLILPTNTFTQSTRNIA